MPQKLALLVGVHDYAKPPHGTFADLNTSSDVAAIRQALINKFGFSPSQITVLTSKTDTTRNAILTALRTRLIERTHQGDVVYFHYSGHGSQLPDPEKPDGFDQTLVPSDYAEDGSRDIRDTEVSHLLEELAQKRPGGLMLSFDCCHSGTITRGGRMLVRGKSFSARFPDQPQPRIATAARGGRMLVRGNMSQKNQNYVTFSACRSDQSALEMDDGNHQAIGRFSYFLAHALGEANPQTTYRDLFEKISADMAARYPDQTPQVEGNLDTALLGGTALEPQPYIPVTINEAGEVVLQAGTLGGVTPGSRFALYGAGTKDFSRSRPLAEVTVTFAHLTDSRLRVISQTGPNVDPRSLGAARAVEIAHEYGDNRVRVDPGDFRDWQQGKALLEQLKTESLIDTTSRPHDVADVRITRTAGMVRLTREDGGALIAQLTEGSDMPEHIREALAREAKWRFTRSLNNENVNSPVRVEMRVMPAEVSGNEEVGVTYVRDRGWGDSQGRLNDGAYVTVELRNIGSEDAYITLLDLQSDGQVGQIWPPPLTTDNVIPRGHPDKWVKLWVGTLTNPAPFIVGKPYGVEMFKAIATKEHIDLSALSRTRGASSPLEQLLRAAQQGTRARIAVVPSSWATATAEFWVQAGR